MPEVTVTIGERNFNVACQAGEEHFLIAAARMVDAEAMSLLRQIGRMPEVRMLLMSSLLLADKTAAMEDQVRQAEARIAELEADISRLQSQQVAVQRVEVPVEVVVEVPMIPPSHIHALQDLAEHAEYLAGQLDQRLAG